jgi:hypothetical protein
MRCRYCRVMIYFTGILYRGTASQSYFCAVSPTRMHQH